jgi:T-complex protein 1 subunit eta
VNNVVPQVIGTCETFEEKQVGGERFNLFKGCPCAMTTTIVLRGGAEQFIAEVRERRPTCTHPRHAAVGI